MHRFDDSLTSVAANTIARLAGLVKGTTMWNSKPKRRTCNCRRRSRHNPKVGGGLCYLGYREALKLRVASKRLAQAWLDAVRGGDADDFDG